MENILTDANLNVVNQQCASLYDSNKIFRNFIDMVNTLITDTYLAGGVLLSKPDDVMSRKMSNIFTGTNVDYYILRSELPNAFTVPGAEALGKKNILGIGNLFKDFQIFFNLAYMGNLLLNTSKTIDTINPTIINGKIKCNLSSIAIYHTKTMFNILSPDENFAIDLHEIGHNMILKQTAFARMASLILNVGSAIYFPFLLVGLSMMVIKFIIANLERPLEVKSDDFAINMGYGSELASAFEKIKHFFKSHNFANDGVMKTLYRAFNSVFFFIGQIAGYLRMEAHPDVWSRIKKAKDNASMYEKKVFLNQENAYKDVELSRMMNGLLMVSNKLLEFMIKSKI